MKFSYSVVAGLVVHIIQLLAIFDIYFTSPLVTNLQADEETTVEPLANRLVLFVCDGLRADTFFSLDSNGKSNAPFLRNVVEDEASWGISHTHLPTESRPGHVALIAGFYEDVSAIMKGWKENPVEFDSVLNRSAETWSWGHPEIVNMFAKGIASNHVHTSHYVAEYDSFADKNASKLDVWVFDKVTAFFNEAAKNETLKEELNGNKIVFFLHLLGLDTNGHSFKPKSSEYKQNLRVVDEGIQRIVNTMNAFYNNDGKTAYVFTSDHGMTDWGSHGDADPTETETPLVVWGSGVATAKYSKNTRDKQNHGTSDDVISSWGLDHNCRNDMEQADVAPLMSALIGVPYPVNSVGVLHTNYLSCDAKTKAILLNKNAKQINQQFLQKMKNTQQTIPKWMFKPFPHLTEEKCKDKFNLVSTLIFKGKYDESMALSSELIELSLRGLRYFHTYHRTFLYLCIVLSVLGWLILTCISVIKQLSFIVRQSSKEIVNTNVGKLFFVCLALFLCGMMMIFRVKWTYYVYTLLPCIIWFNLCNELSTIITVVKSLSVYRNVLRQLSGCAIVGLCGVTSLVGSFFYRSILTAELLIFAVAPYFLRNDIESNIKYLWSCLCFLLAVFPLLPVVQRDPNMFIVLFSGCVITLVNFVLNSLQSNFPKQPLVLISFFAPSLAGAVAFVTARVSNDFGDVPWIIHIISWTLLLCSIIVPMLHHNTQFPDRLLMVNSWLSTAYMLVCLSYDALFLIVFVCLLYLWIHVEFDKTHQTRLNRMDFTESTLLVIGAKDHKSREPDISDLRRSYMLVFFMVLAFFGVGNIASINSFDVRVVYPFLTTFNMFVMAGLLAYKVLLPYLILMCSFSAVAMATRISFGTICAIVMVISDIMSLIFMFLVRDEGSWLDIGTSISHFIIVMSMNFALLVFFLAAKLLTTTKLKLKWPIV